MQSAFSTSVPRLKPLSTNTGNRPPTADSILAAHQWSTVRLLASGPVIRHDYGVDASLDGLRRILVRKQTLDHDLHLRRVSHTLDGVPRESGCLNIVEPR